MNIRILHTNDVHSRFENFARIVSKIRELKDDNTLTLDAGDFNDFMRLELQGTNGRAGCSLLNIAGYDAITVGNNEDEMKNLKQDFHDMYDHVVNISSSEKADADNKEALILLVLTLVTQAAINKRIAEKIIDEFFTANK